ncbi:MAG: peptidoglycan DD-metalloendopeptidase family protein, partial [Thermoanaerobaculia bacterium]
QKGDWFKVLVEGLYLDGKFKRYGKILYSEFFNNGNFHKAYYFEKEDGYFDERGKNKLRAFLKTPLNFKRISSSFSYSRYHPILKIYRPHYGIDFVAPAGTPVSSVGDGKVEFAGFKGQYGNLVVIKHSNGWESYYGHLSKFGKGIREGVKIKQGDIIGYVGSSGLATGAHLHYELKAGKRAVNPFKIKIPEGKEIPKDKMEEFLKFKDLIDRSIKDLKFEKKYIMEDLKWALN